MLQGALNRNDKQRMIGSFAHFYQKNLILGLATVGYFFIVSTLSIPARFLLRKNMGERAVSIPSFFIALIVYVLIAIIALVLFSYFLDYGLYAAFMEYLSYINSDAFSVTWSEVFFTLLILLISPFTMLMALLIHRGLLHFRSQLKNHRERVIGYSFYRGESLYFKDHIGGRKFGFEINDRILRMLVEPLKLIKLNLLQLLICIACLVFRSMNPVETLPFQLIDSFVFGAIMVNITLFLSSIALFFEEFSIMQKGRAAILDMIDGEFDMETILAIKEDLIIRNPSPLESNLLT